jgi:predicted MFS family arabinose efflux permease
VTRVPVAPPIDEGGAVGGARSPPAWRVAAIFGAFAFSYFVSALLRAIVATLAPEFARDLQLGAGHLGLLAGVYFLGFACMQLPVGWALDRWGARRVLLGLMVFAVIGCVAFGLSASFGQLVLARLLIGMGVSASLMAPLALFVRLFERPLQLRLNAWMLMSGSLGMVASTLPVQALLPLFGWRALFHGLGALLVAAMVVIAVVTPGRGDAPHGRARAGTGYRGIVAHPMFLRCAPLGFFSYGGLIAVQSLWAGPWLTEVAGASAVGAAQGLFAINLSMLGAFLAWGLAMPRLAALGLGAERLIGWCWPIGALVMVGIVALGREAGAAWLAAWCVCTSVITLSQPAVAQAFPRAEAGRALSAFNLLIFLGVFACQWGIGITIDALLAIGWDRAASQRAAFMLQLFGHVGAGLWYWSRSRSRAARVARARG